MPPNKREETPPHDQLRRPHVPEDANEYRYLDVPHSDAPQSTQLHRAIYQEPSFLDERLPRPGRQSSSCGNLSILTTAVSTPYAG